MGKLTEFRGNGTFGIWNFHAVNRPLAIVASQTHRWLAVGVRDDAQRRDARCIR
jgi:hypothetical protein